MQWMMFAVWRRMHSPLPNNNHFRRILHLQLRYREKPKSQTWLGRLATIIPSQLMGCLTGLGLVVLSVWMACLCIIVVSPIAYLVFDQFPTLVITFNLGVGAYLGIRIFSKLNKLRAYALYDLIGASTYGIQRAIWLIGRTVYKDMRWLKDTRIMISNGLLIMIGFLIALWFIGFLSAIVSPNTISANVVFLYSASALVLMLMAVYLSFVHAMVLGYLVAIWSIGIETDSFSRLVIASTLFLSVAFVVYIGVLVLVVIGLPRVYEQVVITREPLPLFALQFSTFALIQESSIRLLVWRIAKQADMPYGDWREEVGI